MVVLSRHVHRYAFSLGAGLWLKSVGVSVYSAFPGFALSDMIENREGSFDENV